MSAAEAFPALTKKFACRSLTRASPCEKPFRPSSSIMRPAEPPGGFLKMQPALFCPSGWLERRFSLQIRMPWRISLYGLEGSLSAAEDFDFAFRRAIDFHFPHERPDLRSIRARVHPQRAPHRARHPNQSLHAA